jgi:hypothetical protein
LRARTPVSSLLSACMHPCVVPCTCLNIMLFMISKHQTLTNLMDSHVQTQTCTHSLLQCVCVCVCVCVYVWLCTYHLSGMMLCAMDAAMRSSNSCTGLPAPRRECVPIMKASTNGCSKQQDSEEGKTVSEMCRTL